MTGKISIKRCCQGVKTLFLIQYFIQEFFGSFLNYLDIFEVFEVFGFFVVDFFKE